MWIEIKGRQHRVYWRKAEGGRAYEPFASRAAAEAFRAAAKLVGPDEARQLLAIAPASPLAPASAASDSSRAPGQALTLRHLHDRYWSENADVTGRTRDDADKRFLHHIEPYFGTTDVRSIRKVAAMTGELPLGPDGQPLSVARWVNWLQAQPCRNNKGLPREGTALSAKTIHNLHADLHALFEHLLDSEEPGVGRNPCDKIALPEIQREEMAFLEVLHFHTLAAVIDPWFRPLIIFLFATGVRWGEAAGLLVKNVHLNPSDGRPYVHIRLAWRREKGSKMHLGRVKSRASQRRITLSPRAVALLRPLVQGKGPNERVFTMRGGGPLHHSNFTRRFLVPAVLRAAEIHRERAEPGRSFDIRVRAHTFRHSHVSLLISAGRPLTTIARRVGHEDTKTTERIYGHLLAEVDDEDLAVVDEALTDLIELEVPDIDTNAQEEPESFVDDEFDALLPEIEIDDEDDIAA